MQGLGYIPISPAYPQKENRLILKGWGVKLGVLGWIFWIFNCLLTDSREPVKVF